LTLICGPPVSSREYIVFFQFVVKLDEKAAAPNRQRAASALIVDPPKA
jgi:hypothetical protein